MHNEELTKAEETEVEETTFRWLDVVRYAAAVVVGLLAVGVLVGAILVVLRPDALDVTVIHGSLLAEVPPERPPKWVRLTFHLFASNPSGRATLRFTNVNLTISTAAADETIPTRYELDDIDVPPEKKMEVISVQNASDPTGDVGNYFISRLADGKSIGVTMVVEGILATELSGEGTIDIGRKGKFTSYTCLGITLGVDRSLNYTDDVSCTRKGNYLI